jgi:hypothetical protein
MERHLIARINLSYQSDSSNFISFYIDSCLFLLIKSNMVFVFLRLFSSPSFIVPPSFSFLPPVLGGNEKEMRLSIDRIFQPNHF